MGRTRDRVRILSVALIVILFVTVITAVVPTTAAAEWVDPVDAPVVDPFRPPSHDYGPGNRGLEYGTTAGQPVVAVDDGVVTFAGAVGRSRHVVIDHGNGLRSTAAHVETIAVVRGQRVRRGRTIATAASGFHLTARLDGVYVDPAILLGGGEVVVALVDGPVAASGAVSPPSRASLVADAVLDLRPSAHVLAVADGVRRWHHAECTDDPPGGPGATPSVAPHGRILVQVGGLGTSSDGASIGRLDPAQLGYDHDDVVAFSYAGGCAPTAFGAETAGALTADLAATGHSSPYRPDHTFQTVERSATRLAELVRAIAAARPGIEIDIAAHSLGGAVTRRAVELLGADAGPLIGHVTTIGSPHSGTELVAAAAVVAGSDFGADVVDALGGAGVATLREADSVTDLAASAATGAPTAPPPTGVDVLAVAGAADLTVTAEHAVWDGARNVLVGADGTNPADAHAELPGRPEVLREMALHLTGAAPRCVGLGEVLADTVTGRAIAAGEDLLTVVAGAGAWLW